MEEDKTIGIGEEDEGDEQPDVNEGQVNENQVNQVQVNEEQVNEDQQANETNEVNEDQPPQISARQEEIIEPIASHSGANNSQSIDNINEPQERRQSSRSVITQNPKSWKSANAFINFVSDFRAILRDKPEIKQAQILRLAGEHWRAMSEEEKHPYIAAANLVRSKNAKLKINKPAPKRKRRQSKGQMKKRQKPIKKPKILKVASDSEDSGEESDISGDSGKTSENDSIDSDT